MTQEEERFAAARRAALESVDRAEQRFKGVVLAAAAMETGLLATFLWLMDFDEPLHWLLLVSAGLVYGTLGIGLVALGAYVRMSTLRVLKALELRDGDAEAR